MANQRRPNDDPDSAGQSGDIQQISNVPDADSESVEELQEEGNAFEASVIDGVENVERRRRFRGHHARSSRR